MSKPIITHQLIREFTAEWDEESLDGFNGHGAQVSALLHERDKVWDALAELVRLKNLKDKAEFAGYKHSRHYTQLEKDKAWAAARAVLERKQ